MPTARGETPDQTFRAFLQRYLAVVRPLMVGDNLASWKAAATGKPADYAEAQKYETEYKQHHANKRDFVLLKSLKGKIRDPLLARQYTLIYEQYAQNQIPPDEIARIVALSTRIQKIFNTHRGVYQGKPVSDNDLLAVLQKETDSRKRREAWEAQKSVGEAVAPLMIQLVKMRNHAARELGYRNYYAMSLSLGEQDVAEVFRIFDDLAARTDAPFRKMKATIDHRLAARWGIKPEEMRPWHYQDFFFQDPPDLGAVDLDAIFAKRDVAKMVGGFYKSINLDPSPILARSDLYERPGKYQHAQSGDLDREGDVRVMANLRNNTESTETVLHELGHGVYAFYCDRTLPFLLRDAAHAFTTEGVADMFGRLTYNPEWLVKVAGADPAAIAKVADQLRFNDRMGQLVFARWSEVMAHFERQLYENPDQDLDALWWRLVEKYQYVHPPEGRHRADWASKIHFVTNPGYYHNYLLGRLFGSQLTHTLANLPPHRGKGVTFSFVDRPDAGAFLIAKVFYPGTRWRWDEMIRRATGEPLTARYYVEDFVQ
jgi:peptidyl-dipeptidase A